MMTDFLKHIAKIKGNTGVDLHISMLKVFVMRVLLSDTNLKQFMKRDKRNVILAVHKNRIFIFKVYTLV